MTLLPLADNPAVTDPVRTLTLAERNALKAIGFYRRQARRAGLYLFGETRVAATTIASLRGKGLIKGEVPAIKPTIAGGLAIDVLKRIST